MELKVEKISGSQFSYKWEDALHKTDVEIRLPNLRKLKSSVWGDWGPMYSFQLEPEDPISISYNGKERRLEQKTLPVESPTLAAEREQFPFYILIEDNEYGFNHLLFLDKTFKLKKVVVKRMRGREILYENSAKLDQLSAAM